MKEDKLGTLEEAIEFDKKRNYQYTTPVAWIAYDEFGDFMLEPTPDGDYSWQPLYTAPRELSDEEIRQIYIETMESPYTHQQSYFGFARAVLRKAQEK